MSYEVLLADQYRQTAWKNGRGTTLEIAIWPRDARFSDDNFTWRLSTALISESGDFSVFRGYDRLLLVVAGDELILHSEKPKVLTSLKPGSSHYFSGETKIWAEVRGGPVKDLGLIYRRGLSVEFDLITLTQEYFSLESTSREVALAYIAQGSAEVEGASENVGSGSTIFLSQVSRSLKIRSERGTATTVASIKIQT